MARMRRTTFRRRSGNTTNTAALARRSILSSAVHRAHLATLHATHLKRDAEAVRRGLPATNAMRIARARQRRLDRAERLSRGTWHA